MDFGPRSMQQTRTGDEKQNSPATYQGIFVLNEGNYNWNNASLSFINTVDNSAYNNEFAYVNGGILGDIAQSMTIVDNTGYIMVDNSNKVEVFNLSNLNSIQSLSMSSPRYMANYNGVGFFSSIYGNRITVVDLYTFNVKAEIATYGWTERMVVANSMLYVCHPGNNNLLVIDPVSFAITDSISVRKGIESIVVDSDENVWVLCSGGIAQELPALYNIDPANNTITSTFLFSDINRSPGRLQINGSGTTFYFTDSDVYSMSTAATALPTTPLILANGRLIYGLGIDPINENVCVTDAKDYVQDGTLLRYDNQGALIDSFTVGIIPQDITFNY